MTRGLDHVVHAVRDLDAAKACYAALGFTTTPNALHPWGTGNSLVQFERSFVEILGIAQPERIVPAPPGGFSFGAFNRDFLARREGMSMLVFSSDDADADIARWRADGLETFERFDFERAATLPGGERVKVAFSLGFVRDARMPDAMCFVCQQHYPENFWKPHYQRHDNGAARMESVWLQSDDPGASAAFLARLFPHDSRVVAGDGAARVELGYGRVEVCTPRALALRFPGVALPGAGRGPAFAAVGLRRAQGATGAVLREAVGGLVVELA